MAATTGNKLDSDDGLPKGEIGRIGLAISESSPNVVYALTEAKKSVLLRSDDGGYSFTTVNKKDGIAPRPFYFCDIRVDTLRPPTASTACTQSSTYQTTAAVALRTLVGWDAAHPDPSLNVDRPN